MTAQQTIKQLQNKKSVSFDFHLNDGNYYSRAVLDSASAQYRRHRAAQSR